MIDPIDSHEAMEPIDRAEPTLAIEPNDPTLPIESTDPREPMHSTESCDQRDHFEEPLSMPPQSRPAGGIGTGRSAHQG